MLVYHRVVVDERPPDSRDESTPGPEASTGGLGSTASGLFGLTLVIALLSFGMAVLLLTGARNGLTPGAEETPSPAQAVRTQTPAATPVRILSSSGSTEPVGGGAYRVTFVWTLEGAREGDSALVRLMAGTRVVTDQRGVLDANVFSSSSGKLTLATSQECSADGWSAELVLVRNVQPQGDAVARVRGVTCR